LIGRQNWRIRYLTQVGGRSERKAGRRGTWRKPGVGFEGKTGRCNIRRKSEVGWKVSSKIKCPTKDWKLVRREDRRSSNRRKSVAELKERPKGCNLRGSWESIAGTATGLVADASRRLIQSRAGDPTTDGSGGWSKEKPEDL